MTHPLRHYLIALGLSVTVNVALLQLVLWINTATQPTRTASASHRSEFHIDRSAPPKPSRTRPSPVPTVQAAGLAVPKLALPSAIPFRGPRLDALALDPGLPGDSREFNGDNLIFKEDAVDAPSKVVSRKMPRYPRLARQQRIEGYVLFRIVVGPDGAVESTHLLDSRPPGIFEASAEKAITQFRYSPARVDGQAVRSYKRQKIKFILRK